MNREYSLPPVKKGRALAGTFIMLLLVHQMFMFVIVGNTSFAFDNNLLDLSLIPFLLVGGLYGYVISFICFLTVFIAKLITDGYTAHILAIYMMGGFVMSMASEYRMFRTKKRTVITFFITTFLVSLVAAMNEMVRNRDYVYRTGLFESYVAGYSFAIFVTCVSLYLFLNYAPDRIKSCFPLGIVYTREYVENLLLQEKLKKTRLSVKITVLTTLLALIMGISAGFYANLLMPDMHSVVERMEQRQSAADDAIADEAVTAPPDQGTAMELSPGDTDPVSDPFKEDTRLDPKMLNDRYLISFNLKLFLMLLCVAFPIVGLINFYAKMRICSPVGELSGYMMSFMDTTDENRMEYAESIKNLDINTRDEISDLYRSVSTTVMEVTDYIEDIRQEAKLREDLRVAQAASEAKSVFLSNMSHEIRTPINAVLGMDEMILREGKDPEILRYAADIKSAGNTLLSLVNDILDFSKIEAGKMDILPAKYQLSSMINDLINMIKEKAAAKDLELVVHVDENIPDALFGDELRVKQCVTNLLTNAVKYTEKGKVTLEVGYKSTPAAFDEEGSPREESPAASDECEEHILLCFRVTDTGIGIKEEDLNRLFSPFERIEEIRNRTIEGTGLGMSIVKKLLAMMDTKLEVKSVYGEGSDFYFEVSQGVINQTPIGNFEERYKEIASQQVSYSELFHAPDAHILVTDDTDINLTVVKGLLKQTQIKVDTALSGFETLDKVKENIYDLIFLDHRMPKMDGVETLMAMKEMTGNLSCGAPVIALTANAVSGARDEYIAMGFTDYLAKPVNGRELEKLLLKYLPAEKLIRPGDPEFVETSNASGGVSTDGSGEDPASEFSEYTGIDVAAALQNTGSGEVLADVLKEFYDSIPEKSERIERLFKEGDIREYTVQVHALKSSARIIGAADLSAKAAHLEDCGNAGDTEEIAQKTPELLELYRSYLEHLKAAGASPDEDADKPLIDEEELRSALTDMKQLVEAYDLTSAEQIAGMLKDYRFPEGYGDRMKEIFRAVGALDRDRLLEALNA